MANDYEDSVEEGEEARMPYPWARALMIVVLYGALMIFLWLFPTPGGQAFFQRLFTGFLYIFAGLLLVGVTLLAILMFPFPRIPWLSSALDEMEDEVEAYDPAEEAFVDDIEDYWPGLLMANTVLVPTFRKPDGAITVWTVLEELEETLKLDTLILADPKSGVIAVTSSDAADAADMMHELRERLEEQGIKSRLPR
jgi:hypothetical protein